MEGVAHDYGEVDLEQVCSTVTIDLEHLTATAGTKTAETRSARRWMGAWLRCASVTRRTMRASIVSVPTARASRTKDPWPFTQPCGLAGSPAAARAFSG
jgi:hypothetical protein